MFLWSGIPYPSRSTPGSFLVENQIQSKGQPLLGVIMCLICLNSLVPMCSKNSGVGLLGNYPEKTIPHVENLYIQGCVFLIPANNRKQPTSPVPWGWLNCGHPVDGRVCSLLDEYYKVCVLMWKTAGNIMSKKTMHDLTVSREE